VLTTILNPEAARAAVPALASTRHPQVWVYRYEEPSEGWTLSVATHAEPGSGKLSLGGFRIAPVERVTSEGFTADREAIQLAIGMEEKVHWSRVIGVGGPLARRDLTRIVGGKCVLVPSADARVGQARDTALLDFAVEGLQALEAAAGIHVVTGQDLGHGLMSDGGTPSLHYLHQRFAGSVVADTSVPTGEGNYRLLVGMLRACGVDIAQATVGLVGAGNIGTHIIGRLRAHGTQLLVVEAREERRNELAAAGARVYAPADKLAMVAEPLDALVVNAAGGSLDTATVSACAANARLRVVCGSENLVMPDASDVQRLRQAGRVFAPTELGGMMGYLTAVEQYLAQLEGVPFDVQTLLVAAATLETAGEAVTARIVAGGHSETFAEAVEAVYGG
jgi:hypothetical protein